MSPSGKAPPAGTPTAVFVRYTMAVLVSVRHRAMEPTDGLNALIGLGWRPELAAYLMRNWWLA